MPTRSFFNDPAFAQAAANLSQLFAPPSGADASGWARANAEKQQAEREGLLWQYVSDPNFDQTQFDRMGVASGRYNPSQSYYAVDTNDATTRRGHDLSAATQRYGYDRTFEASRLNNADDNTRSLATNRLDNQRQAVTSLYGSLAPGHVAPAVPQEFMELLQMPGVPERRGAPQMPSETEWRAAQTERLLQNGRLTDDDLIDTIMGDKTPVQAIGPSGAPAFMHPGRAVREGAQPYDAPKTERIDNFLALGPNNEEVRFPGYTGPDGRIYDANTGQAVANVIRKEGTGGGMSLEVDGEGGVRFSTGGAGNTVARQTELSRQRDDAALRARELTTIYDNLNASDVGVAGNLNDFLTRYGAQAFPGVARTDVSAMRSQIEAATIPLARTLSGDARISNLDREAAQRAMVDTGLGESVESARAKLAALIAISAYRSKFAGQIADGDGPLPPIDEGMLREMVDAGDLSPAVASEFARSVLSRRQDRPAIGAASPAPAVSAPSGNRLRFDENGNVVR